MSDQQLKTACHEWHATHGGRMVDFAGWQMPVQYTTITEEHLAVRNAAGLFDVAHMGRLKFTGPDACRFLDHLVTCDVTKMPVGRIRYALMTNDEGGILDDVLVSRSSDSYGLVVNASNRKKIVDWLEQHLASFDTDMDDLTCETFMLALQGPNSTKILNPQVADDVSELRYYHGIETEMNGVPTIVTRTGYTGEEGFEVVASADNAIPFWEKLIETGEQYGLVPAGLGCRDTLRLEAGMPLYGHELDEKTDPFTAGLGFAVKLDAADFIGRDALIAAKANEGRKRRVGLELTGRRIAREGAVVLSGDREVGQVTSGTFSPTLKKSLAMAYVPPGDDQPGTVFEVDIRGKRDQATVVDLPFYRRQR